MTRGIYLIFCVDNKRRYVGSSKNLEFRWKKHQEELKRGDHANRHLQRAWNKYGSGSFSLSTIEVVANDGDLLEREQHWLDILHPEFNETPFANRPTNQGKPQSDEARKRISESNKRTWAAMSSEERERRRKLASHPHTEATKKLLSEKGRASPSRYWKGKHFSKETREKISLASQKQFAAERAAKVQRRAEWELGQEERDQERRRKLSLAITGKTHTEETKKKLRRIATKQMNDPKIKKKHRAAVRAAMKRPEVLQRLSESHKGRTLSEAHKKNIGKAHKGMKRSESTKAKMRASQRARWKIRKSQSQ